MGLLKRVSRLVQTNLPSPAQPEDSEQVLEQSVAEIQQELLQLRQSIALAIATQKRCEHQQSQVEGLATDWQQRAQLAVQRGEELLSHEALNRRQFYLEQSQKLQEQIEVQRRLIGGYKQTMDALEIKLDEARARRGLLPVRADVAACLHQNEAEQWFAALKEKQARGETASL